jgi:hypothetical protein
MIVYRGGKRMEFSVEFSQGQLPPIRRVYPGYESIDYEVGFGMVVMELTVNHIQMFASQVPGLMKYTEMKHQGEPVLLITNIFTNSQLHRSRALPVGATINEVNGVAVKTLEDYRNAIKQGAHEKFFTIKASDNVARASDNIFIALSKDKALEEETSLSRDFKYPISDVMRLLLADVPQQEIS